MPPDSPADSGNLARLKVSDFHPLRTFRSVIAWWRLPRGDGMIIKHIARFVRAQDWNAIAIEFVIVTAGVLMGIQVSNWNEARVEKAQKSSQQVASLGTELQGNLATIGRYERNVKSTSST